MISRKLAIVAGAVTVTIGAVLGHVSVAVAAKPAIKGVQWAACAPAPEGLPDGGQKCATLQVPVDYSKPQGRKLQIAVSRIAAADQSKKRGVLLFNPGGPGGSGLDMPRIFSQILPQEITSQYDLIGFDPRGVGGSTPISCGLSEADAFRAFTPMELPGGFDATKIFMQRVANDCTRAVGPNLPFITTNNTARDMDRIREALGAQKISYLGYSYGTRLGAAYAALFPDKTDRVILDSSVDPNKAWRDQFLMIAGATEERFDDFAAFLVKNEGVYHLGKSPAEVRALLTELIAHFNEHPTDVPGFMPDGVPLTGEVIRRATFGGMYSDGMFSYLAEQMAAVKGIKDSGASGAAKKKAAAAAGLEVASDNNVAVAFSILCNDNAWVRSLKQYRADAAAYQEQYPLFGKAAAALWPCAFWPQTNSEAPVRVTPGGPKDGILIMQNLRDPATPYEGALGMRRALGDRAKMVSVDAGGHGTYLSVDNTCAFEKATNYLAKGEMPASDVLCAAETGGDKFKAFGTAQSSARDAALRELRRSIR